MLDRIVVQNKLSVVQGIWSWYFLSDHFAPTDLGHLFVWHATPTLQKLRLSYFRYLKSIFQLMFAINVISRKKWKWAYLISTNTWAKLLNLWFIPYNNQLT